MLCPTIGIRRGWAAPGGMIIQITSKQHIGGAMKKKDQPEWMTDGRSLEAPVRPKTGKRCYQQLATKLNLPPVLHLRYDYICNILS
jgi:hypothetical protein